MVSLGTTLLKLQNAAGEELCGEKYLGLEHTESRVYGTVPQTVQGLQNLTGATMETSPLRSSLARGCWEHCAVPSFQRHSSSTAFQSRVQSTHALGEGLSPLEYLQRVPYRIIC